MLESLSTIPLASPVVLVRRLVRLMAIATLFLMALGSATRVMNAGLSCPDWPLCYGELVPQMNLQVFLEWFHRLVASTMGLLTLTLTAMVWWWRRSLPNWLRWYSLVALSLVVWQGALGALTVTELLRFDIVTAHLGTGLLFFGTLTAGAIALSDISQQPCSPRFPWLGLVTVVIVYGQSILGGLVASQWALHQCLAAVVDFCQVMNNHLLGVAPACLSAIATAIWAMRQPSLRGWGWVTLGLVLLQVAIGYATYRLHLQVAVLTVTHQSIGAMLLGALIATTVLGFRHAEINLKNS